jgi:nitroimidazol reductase NimA-like FMN-containing flavoprotein (pyridoxamine 5'-phosphate oxidase superfamily)
MKLKKSLARLIELERVSRVATSGQSGMPHVVPVCHVLADGKIYFASGSDGRKVLNLRANPKVAVTVDVYSDAWPHLTGVMVQGTATLIDKGPRFRKIRALLYRKYPQYPDEAALDESDSVIGEVTPIRVFSWGVE